MNCTYCNTKIDIKNKFCPNCGTPIIIEAAEDIYKNKEGKWRVILYTSTIIGMIIFLLLAVYLGFIAYKYLYTYACNDEMFASFDLCTKFNDLNINYNQNVLIIGSIIMLITGIIQIISYFKLRKIYRYNLKNNIVRPNKVYVKKSTYIILASMFGMIGVHKFYAKKYIQGSIFLISFFGSIVYMPLLILLAITTSISYADVTDAMAQKADSNKNIML